MEQNYIDRIAAAIHQEANGKELDLTGEYARLYRIYAVLALSLNTTTDLRDVHDAWSAWASHDRPNHQSLLPFEQLTEEVQELDRKYRDAIVRVSRNLPTLGA